ncbi:Hsp20/alpha crystallin family protein [Azotobacter bryophylli]|uniref:Hsp20/alpha crystallin family protein n=1 Tax=Azotobacter bryophylli TaxID=1986537 RepID=A0ABV7AYP9_9GAMM
MADTEKQVPVNGESGKSPESPHPLERLRRQIDHLFSDFNRKALRSPFGRNLFEGEPLWSRELFSQGIPAVDISDKGDFYELSAELPGMDEKDVQVRLANRVLTIKGEKKEEKEDRKKDSYFSERYYGSFQRSFNLPEVVDTDRIEATFKKGVLTLNLPKKPEAVAAEKTIEIKPS